MENLEYTEPVLGLQPDEANKAISEEICRVISLYRQEVQKSMCLKQQCRIALAFLTSFEGAVISICMIMLTVGECLIAFGGHVSNRWWCFCVSIGLILPSLTANIFIFWKLRRAEQIRPFAQVEEALRILQESYKVDSACNEDTNVNRPESIISEVPEGYTCSLSVMPQPKKSMQLEYHLRSMYSNFSVWDPPSATEISTYRGGLWCRIPSVMIAKGDVFKLRLGERFPTDAVRVELVLNHCTTKEDTVCDSHTRSNDFTRKNLISPPIDNDLNCPKKQIHVNENGCHYNLCDDCQTQHYQVFPRQVKYSRHYNEGEVFQPIEPGGFHSSAIHRQIVFPLENEDSKHSIWRDALALVSMDKQEIFNSVNTHSHSTPKDLQTTQQDTVTSEAPPFIALDTSRHTQGDDYLLKDSTTTHNKNETYETLQFPPSLLDCNALAIGTFQATSFACTVPVTTFLKKSLHPKAVSKRRHTTFFEMTRIVYRLLIKVFFILLIISVLFNLFWSIRVYTHISYFTFGMKQFAIIVVTENTLQSVFLGFSFMPLVHRILIEVTDVWGNARLQSLFQWLQDTRIPVTEESQHQKGIRSADSSLSAYTSSSSNSIASSVDSNMSVSRLPLRNQFIELIAVLRQGLDGASNLLHTLNATTSVVFVDKEGILTDTQRSIQEVCVAKHITTYDSTFNKTTRQTGTSTTSQPTQDSTIIKEFNYGNNKKTIYNQIGTCTPQPDRIVFDVLPKENTVDGQRFEDHIIAKSYLNVLKPFVSIMACTKLPLSELQYQDLSSCNWLFAQTIRDILQSDGLLGEAFKECLCSLKSLCGVKDSIVNSLSISRFMFAVQSRTLKHAYSLPSPMNLTEVSPLITSEGQVLLGIWLLKDLKTGLSQLVSKGHPRALLRRSAYYFDGETIVPMSRSLRRSLLALTIQWKGNGLECVAFGYRPLNKKQQYTALHALDEHSVFIVEPDCMLLTSNTLSSYPVPFSENDQQRIQSENYDGNPFIMNSYVSTTNGLDGGEGGGGGDLRNNTLTPFIQKKITQQQQCMKQDMSQCVLCQPKKNKKKPSYNYYHDTLKNKKRQLIKNKYSDYSHLSHIGPFQKWTKINVFPGPRSSIGSVPPLSCQIPFDHFNYQLLNTMNSDKSLMMPQSISPFFINYNNLIVPCTPFFKSGNQLVDSILTTQQQQRILQLLPDQSTDMIRENVLTSFINNNFINKSLSQQFIPNQDLHPNKPINSSFHNLQDHTHMNLSLPSMMHSHDKKKIDSVSHTNHHNDPKKIGQTISQLVNSQIFLGMVALRMSTPQEVASRVHIYHEAGIRFVYMSRENNKKTKSVGQLLGLETDWNCLISLAPLPRGIVNVEGNVVVPSGISNIRDHIINIDNVPLQVSLFSNGSPETMKEMIKILQENGEIVTCVGSARRTSNFDLFDQANCSISVAVDKSPICKDCLGRRCVGYINRHIFPSLPSEYRVAAALTSLPCSLQIHMESLPPPTTACQPCTLPVTSPSDPRWLSELLYEAFKESRRIVDAIQQSVTFFVGVSTCFLGPMFVLSALLFPPPFFRTIAIASTLLVFLPIISITLLHSPACDGIMKELPLRLSDHEQGKKEIRHTCLNYSFRFFPSSFACFFLLCYYCYSIFPKYTTHMILLETEKEIQERLQHVCINEFSFISILGGGWIRCITALNLLSPHSPNTLISPLLHAQMIAHGLMLLFIAIMSLSFIDRIQSLLNVPPTRNAWLLLAWLFIFIIFIIGVCIELAVTQTWKHFIVPEYPFFICLGLWMIIIVTIDELLKKKARKKHALKQKYLKLLFTTRLGMWSPK